MSLVGALKTLAIIEAKSDDLDKLFKSVEECISEIKKELQKPREKTDLKSLREADSALRDLYEECRLAQRTLHESFR